MRRNTDTHCLIEPNQDKRRTVTHSGAKSKKVVQKSLFGGFQQKNRFSGSLFVYLKSNFKIKIKWRSDAQRRFVSDASRNIPEQRQNATNTMHLLRMRQLDTARLDPARHYINARLSKDHMHAKSRSIDADRSLFVYHASWAYK